MKSFPLVRRWFPIFIFVPDWCRFLLLDWSLLWIQIALIWVIFSSSFGFVVWNWISCWQCGHLNSLCSFCFFVMIGYFMWILKFCFFELRYELAEIPFCVDTKVCQFVIRNVKEVRRNKELKPLPSWSLQDCSLRALKFPNWRSLHLLLFNLWRHPALCRGPRWHGTCMTCIFHL